MSQEQSKITITKEDLVGAATFWQHLNIPMPLELQVAFDRFTANPSEKTQDEVKLELCNALINSDHPVFKDASFKDILEECELIAYSLSFQKDLEDLLREKE